MAGLRETIRSVLLEQRVDFEYIIVDGASTDGSVDVIKENQNGINLWISEPDNGIYNAMNKGIIRAEGEYCLFLNSGDLLESHALRHLLPFLDGTADIFYGDAKIRSGAKFADYRMPQHVTLLYLMQSALNHQCCFIRTKLLKQRPYDEDMRIVSDWAWTFAALLDGKSFRHMDIVVACYDMNGISSSNRELMTIERSNYISTIMSQAVINDYQQIISILGDDWHILGLELAKHPHLKKLLVLFLRIVRKFDSLYEGAAR